MSTKPSVKPTLTQFAGMQQHWAAVVRMGERTYVVPETVRRLRTEARAAMAFLPLALSKSSKVSVRVERVYISWEIEVTLETRRTRQPQTGRA